ncbi:MAG: right-handed parallel beta-helix repeat-containing protein, partial [Actinomycetota bacterium]|nr:right-handed parallel beta-helix repeat-containing protein [Actinomycetota bacterium]
MPRNEQIDDPAARTSRGWQLILAAVAAFGLLAAMPVILPLIHLQLHATAATSSHGIKLLPAPRAPRPVTLSPVAQPIDPGGGTASLPGSNTTTEVAAVSAEDNRIRTVLHDAGHIFQPEVIPTRGALPTLVLTAGQSQYSSADLVKYGAMVRLPDHAALLLDNVFVSAHAHLSLGSSQLRTLYLDNGSGGFATIVAWGGNLAFHGSSAGPITIRGWNRAANGPAGDTGTGRSYIREVGGQMTLSDVRVSSLGFWSGRTGGVAWTGLTGNPSTGGATSSTFTDNTYGSFVSRGSGVAFRDDLFEFNELDGLHIHRYSVNTSVVGSSASRNGGSGFIVSPATRSTLLTDDVSEHNARNGYFVNGKPLATGASASGGAVTPGAGTVVKDSAALNNGQIGILVEGGTGTVIESDQVCASVTAVAIRYDVTDAVVTGNDIRCSPRSGLSIGPVTPGLVISGNTIVGPRTGVLVSSSGPVRLDNNNITGATVFGVSARGAASKVTGVGNQISGTGFRSVDARADATMPALSATDASAWVTHTHVTFWSYLRFHPLAALWLGIAILVMLGWAWAHRHRMPAHPYSATTRWPDQAAGRGPADAEPEAPVLAPVPALSRGPALVPAFTPAPAPAPEFTPAPAPEFTPAPAPAPEFTPALASTFAESTMPFRVTRSAHNADDGRRRPGAAAASGQERRPAERERGGRHHGDSRLVSSAGYGTLSRHRRQEADHTDGWPDAGTWPAAAGRGTEAGHGAGPDSEQQPRRSPP